MRTARHAIEGDDMIEPEQIIEELRFVRDAARAFMLFPEQSGRREDLSIALNHADHFIDRWKAQPE